MNPSQILAIKQEILKLEEQLLSLVNQNTMTPTETVIYQKADSCLGTHITLNNAVPADEGCAEAVSYVLKLAGISDGIQGIPGTATLYDWLVASPRFTKVDEPEQGAIIISPTGMGNGSVEGHTGIIGQFGKAFTNDFGIMSNDSASGDFLETWSWTRWNAYYGVTGGLPIYLFRAI